MKNFENYKRKYDWKKPKKRHWPDNEINKAPIWCSVDLRDGNQALPNPMSMEEKISFFDHLINIGFKEIEIGFPAANDTEFTFTRYLIENKKIPENVTIQVISQCNDEMIKKTIDSIAGAKKAIVHLYNSISKVQREVVFNKNKNEIKQIAIQGVRSFCKYIKKYPETEWHFEYSPESLTQTELDYALEIINSILEELQGKISTKPIINLTATVECSTPNIFADQVEYICDNISNRENVIISVHSHNDRGTAVATSEMGLLAGADRIEGTLFGNGERTGNADILTIAMNMYTIGIDPKLDFSNMNTTKKIYEKYTKMQISPRHPYAGEYVFTAFSGSHQDAISKGLKSYNNNEQKIWDVPYLPINPEDINRQYEPIIRINSQSGKGGIAYILESQFDYKLPKNMQKQVRKYFKDVLDNIKRELTVNEVYSIFSKEFKNRTDIFEFIKYDLENLDSNILLKIIYEKNGVKIEKQKTGSGPIEAFVEILKSDGLDFEILEYTQESLNENGAKSQAVSYINLDINTKSIWAIGQDNDVIKSSFKAIISAINRYYKTNKLL